MEDWDKNVVFDEKSSVVLAFGNQTGLQKFDGIKSEELIIDGVTGDLNQAYVEVPLEILTIRRRILNIEIGLSRD